MWVDCSEKQVISMNRIDDSLFHFAANEELIRAFVDAGVEFIVIGGLAVSWYCPYRQADDMDLLINNNPENSVRVSQALHNLNLSGFNSDSFTKLGLQVPLKHTFYAELLTPQKSGPTYCDIASNAIDAKLFNIPVRLASVMSQIQLKELAAISAEEQRDKHLKDIERLKKLI